MISLFTVYDSVTGAIKRTGTAPDSMIAIQAQTGEAVVTGQYDAAAQYLPGGVPTARPAMTSTIDVTTVPADGVTPITISGAPAPCNIDVAGPASYTSSDPDGTIQLTFNLAGTYTVTLSAFPYLNQEFTIGAT